MSKGTYILDRKEIFKAIASGSALDIYRAFVWMASPQGDYYWREKWRNNSKLSKGDISFLKGLVGIKEMEYPEDGSWV